MDSIPYAIAGTHYNFWQISNAMSSIFGLPVTPPYSANAGLGRGLPDKVLLNPFLSATREAQVGGANYGEEISQEK